MQRYRKRMIVMVGILVVLCFFGAILIACTETAPDIPSVTPVPSMSVVPSASPSPIMTVRPTHTPTPKPTTAAVPAQSGVIGAINAQRAAVGVSALSTSRTLQSIAQAHAADMAARQFFSHTDPQGVTFAQRIAAGGYSGSASAENIGLTSMQAVSIVDNWMASVGHQTNMLNATYTAVGVGIANGTWQGMPVVFVVAIFGSTKE